MKTIIAGSMIVILVIITGLWWMQTQKSNNDQFGYPADFATPSSMPTPNPNPENVTFYLVSLENLATVKETFGCGDSLVAVSGDYNTESESLLKDALTKLLNTEQTTTINYQQLYNSLGQSELSIERIEDDGVAVSVYLTGQISLGGVCDNPRLEQQLISSIKANTSTPQVNIFINDKPIQEVLSLKGME